jgi:hypothetical protein
VRIAIRVNAVLAHGSSKLWITRGLDRRQLSRRTDGGAESASAAADDDEIVFRHDDVPFVTSARASLVPQGLPA